MKVVNAGYGDNQEAEQAIKKHTNLHYCADLDTQFYVSIGMLKNSPNSAQMEERVTALHLVAKKFEIDITKSTYTTKDTEKAIRVSVGHIENFKVVGECTVDASLQEEAKKKEEENFVLSTTKLVIEENGFGTVRVLGYPLSDADVEKNSGVKVKSKNENVAVVRYNSATKTITVDAVAPGSTEVEVYLQKKKTSKKQYVQVFSVTVNAEGNVALVNEDMHFCLGEGERYCA